SSAMTLQGGRQDAADRSQGTGQGQLTQELPFLQGLQRNLPRSREHAQGNGKIEAATLLRQIGGRQVDGDAASGKLETGIENGAAHPVLAFLNCCFRQADDGQPGQAIGQMDFHNDLWRGHPRLGAGTNDGKIHSLPWLWTILNKKDEMSGGAGHHPSQRYSAAGVSRRASRALTRCSRASTLARVRRNTSSWISNSSRVTRSSRDSTLLTTALT